MPLANWGLVADYQIIDRVRKALDFNFLREVKGIYCDSGNWYLPHSIVDQQHTVKVTCVLFLRDQLFFSLRYHYIQYLLTHRQFSRLSFL